ncbi:hypothetical protein E3U43_010180 [Larimichthys crocea]|nr:hypothetical protein E3U43_010180 [Larimichthys crocea]
MDVTSHCSSSDITEDRANKKQIQSECISSQPTANGTLPHHTTDPLPAEEAPPPPSDRSEDGDSGDESLTDSTSIDDVSRLLPTQPASALRNPKGVDSSPVHPPPVLTPPSSSFTSPPLSQLSTCDTHSGSQQHHQHSTNQKRLSSTRSHASLKTDAAHIKEVAGDERPMRAGLQDDVTVWTRTAETKICFFVFIFSCYIMTDKKFYSYSSQ